MKAAFGYRPGLRERLYDWVLGHPGTVYFGGIAVLLAAFLALAIGVCLGPLAASWWSAVALAALLLPLSELAVGLVNHLITLLMPPAFSPSSTSRRASRPSSLRSSSSPRCLRQRLERRGAGRAARTHYLSNPDPTLRFALLTDFTDAPNETMPQDEEMVRDALESRPSLERPIPRRRERAGPLLPLPSPTALEPFRGLLDGMGA